MTKKLIGYPGQFFVVILSLTCYGKFNKQQLRQNWNEEER